MAGPNCRKDSKTQIWLPKHIIVAACVEERKKLNEKASERTLMF